MFADAEVLRVVQEWVGKAENDLRTAAHSSHEERTSIYLATLRLSAFGRR